MKSKILHALLSVVIAFGLWLYVITVVSPESEETFAQIPVAWEKSDVLTDNGYMIISDEIPTITLRLKGNRSDLNNLKKSDITVTVDLAQAQAGTDKYAVQIVLPEDAAGVGALGTYTVMVTLTEAEET